MFLFESYLNLVLLYCNCSATAMEWDLKYRRGIFLPKNFTEHYISFPIYCTAFYEKVSGFYA